MLDKIKNQKYKVFILIVEAICMILELCASRVLSPYFGNSNIVWTSVIGIILLSSSIGNYIGGKIADKKSLRNNLKTILLFSAFFVFVIPISQKWILDNLSKTFADIKLGAILGTVTMFFIPSLFLGCINPIIIKLNLKDINTAGEITGKVYAVATIGGIVGTFLGGFFLVPNFGCVEILYVLSIMLFILSFLIDTKLSNKINIFIIVWLLICFGLFSYSLYNNDIKGKMILAGKDQISVSYDTQYGRAIIKNAYYNNEHIRMLNIDSGYESATFIEESKQNELVYNYLEYYDLMFNSKYEINQVMMIGGAGYAYPKHYISTYQTKSIDVVEIDGDITKLAKKFFYLDKLISDYNLNENHRLGLINEDGRTYLNRNTKKYDAILNDAFSGDTPAKTLTTLELIQKIKNSLNENGLYLTNIISSLEGKDSRFIKAEVNTLKKVFKNVYVIPCYSIQDKELSQNNMVIATDQELEFEGEYKLNIDENELVITDDYCPVDTLIPRK